MEYSRWAGKIFQCSTRVDLRKILSSLENSATKNAGTTDQQAESTFLDLRSVRCVGQCIHLHAKQRCCGLRAELSRRCAADVESNAHRRSVATPTPGDFQPRSRGARDGHAYGQFWVGLR